MTDINLEVTKDEINSGIKKANALSGTAEEINAILSSVADKQDTLVSGTNIKTINNTSILGSGNITIEGGGGGTGSGYYPPLLQPTWSDHLINDQSWLRADTFSWQDGTTYSTVYEKLVEEYNASTSVEETEGSVTFKRSSNGFKIATADKESAIATKYNDDGIAWYYILDTDNARFKLPRTKWGFKGLRNNAGDDIEESLPNINGTFAGIYNSNGLSGAFTGAFGTSKTGNLQDASSTTSRYSLFTFNASNSSSAYKDGADVQERATQMYLYFYVGEYSREAIEQTAGITTEQFNNKADIDATNFSTTGLSTLSVLGMPSAKCIDVTLGSSGATYTAPANGYFQIAVLAGISLQLYNITRGSFWTTAVGNSASNANAICCSMPCQKGDTVQCYYSYTTFRWFRFYYVQGENS